jgi:hypothetical protein
MAGSPQKELSHREATRQDLLAGIKVVDSDTHLSEPMTCGLKERLNMERAGSPSQESRRQTQLDN